MSRDIHLAGIRITFFVLLFISTACNRMDGNTLRETQAGAASAVAQAERVRVLEKRVAQLEARLAAVNEEARAYADIPGGVTWD